MRDDGLAQLQARLTADGMPAWRVRRALLELQDHLEALREEAVAAGLTPDDARRDAWQRLGAVDAIAGQFRTMEQAGAWPASQYAAALITDLAGDDRLPRAQILFWRWSLALTFSAVGTLAFFLSLNHILFG